MIGLSILAALPIFYLYRYFPEVKEWNTIFGTIDSQYYESVRTFAWVFLGKFVPLFVITICFFNIKQWWRIALLSPIGTYIYQIINLLNDEFKFKDEALDDYFVVPLSIIICIVLLRLRGRLSFYIEAFRLRQELEDLTLQEELKIEIEQVKKENPSFESNEKV